VISPELGGSILALDLMGHEVLRTAPQRCTNVLETASFPLVPFGNRLTNGKERAGRVVNLPPHPEGNPLALHGHGWRRSWTLLDVTTDRATLELEHRADEWPWAYRVRQHFVLSEAGLEICFELTNFSLTAMPCGFGIHPYFRLGEGSYIRTSASHCLEPDALGMPRLPAPWTPGRVSLADTPGCDCFLLDPAGSVEVGSGDWAITISASEVAGWQLYCPPNSAFFCLEPVSHRPDELACEVAGSTGDCVSSLSWQVELKVGVD
jgi:aldose 1-epimerase